MEHDIYRLRPIQSEQDLRTILELVPHIKIIYTVADNVMGINCYRAQVLFGVYEMGISIRHGDCTSVDSVYQQFYRIYTKQFDNLIQDIHQQLDTPENGE